MLLSLVVHTYSLRYWLPAAVMLGTAPAYLLSWSAWRLLSTMLPSRLYHTVDDCVYSVYQSMVLFFFENYTGVEVSMTIFFIIIIYLFYFSAFTFFHLCSSLTKCNL
uniref:Uncharacterized protein n=1 Tax=Cyprinus carpio TaxID=7962 RepID=A0A8C2BU31_CYPCA